MKGEGGKKNQIEVDVGSIVDQMAQKNS